MRDVTAVIDYDATTASTSCPGSRGSAHGPDNLARVAQYISLFGEVEQKVVDCFRRGGGVPYREYPRFHRLMAEESGEVFDAVHHGVCGRQLLIELRG